MAAADDRVPAHVLLVAHRTAATPRLIEAIRARAQAGPCAFTLLVPCGRGAAAPRRRVLPTYPEGQTEVGVRSWLVTVSSWTTRSVFDSCAMRPIVLSAASAAADAKDHHLRSVPSKMNACTMVHTPRSAMRPSRAR